MRSRITFRVWLRSRDPPRRRAPSASCACPRVKRGRAHSGGKRGILSSPADERGGGSEKKKRFCGFVALEASVSFFPLPGRLTNEREREQAHSPRAFSESSISSLFFYTAKTAKEQIEKQQQQQRSKTRNQYGTFFGRFRLMLAASADRSVSLALPLCCTFLAFRSFFAAAGTSASFTPMAL